MNKIIIFGGLAVLALLAGYYLTFFYDEYANISYEIMGEKTKVEKIPVLWERTVRSPRTYAPSLGAVLTDFVNTPEPISRFGNTYYCYDLPDMTAGGDYKVVIQIQNEIFEWKLYQLFPAVGNGHLIGGYLAAEGSHASRYYDSKYPQLWGDTNIEYTWNNEQDKIESRDVFGKYCTGVETRVDDAGPCPTCAGGGETQHTDCLMTTTTGQNADMRNCYWLFAEGSFCGSLSGLVLPERPYWEAEEGKIYYFKDTAKKAYVELGFNQGMDEQKVCILASAGTEPVEDDTIGDILDDEAIPDEGVPDEGVLDEEVTDNGVPDDKEEFLYSSLLIIGLAIALLVIFLRLKHK